MLVETGCLSAFTNDFLVRKYAYVSPDVDGGSILQELTSGRDGRGGITFVTGNDDNNFAYDLFIQQPIPAASVQTFGIALQQATTQHNAGGRLLTLVDSGEDVLGETTQVGINLMSDGTLRAVRANVAGTGVVLRGLDQGGDSQVTLLGQSTTAIDATDVEFIEIQIFHDSAVGSIAANFYDNTGTLKGSWSLTNVNTAVSGRNQSTSFCYGGYASTNIAIDTRFHEDLQAVISDLYIINNISNPDDANDPVTFIGDRKPLPLFATGSGELTEWTPDPAQANYLNVSEVPPDTGTTENSTDTDAAKDTFPMDTAPSGDRQAYLAYSAFVTSDSPPECGVSGDPARFEAFTYTEQTSLGEVHTTPPTGPPCNLSDFVSRRAQTVCTVSQDGEKVTFKPLSVAVQTDAYFVALTPLDAPPRLQDPLAPSYYAAAGFHPKEATIGFNWTNNINCIAIPGHVSYTLPWYQPWQGLAADTSDVMNTSGDFFEFDLLEDGIGIDVGVVENEVAPAPFSPYTSPIIAFHFREDTPGSPYFWISPSFGYAGETIYNHSPGDHYKIVRNDPDLELYQNGFLLETFPLGVFANPIPYTFMGRWGYVAPFGYIRRPGITNAFVQIGALNCCPAFYDYACLDGQFQANAPEMQQWGVKFNDGFPDCFIYDPGSTHGPWPQAGYDANTRFEFSLESGNIVMRIYDPTFLSGIPNIAGVGTWTYTIPYANTDDFVLQAPIAVGPPDFPSLTLEYDFPTPGANAPLRLGVIFGADNAGVTQGLVDVSFTFVGGGGPESIAGVMRQSGSNRLGTVAEVPTSYRYCQSMLSSTPSDGIITADEFNDAQHGYDSE
jgi:hypothetical protein